MKGRRIHGHRNWPCIFPVVATKRTGSIDDINKTRPNSGKVGSARENDKGPAIDRKGARLPLQCSKKICQHKAASSRKELKMGREKFRRKRQRVLFVSSRRTGEERSAA